jgi:hypothetical protein
MKNIVKAAIGGVAIAGALAIGTGVAQADPSDFQIYGSKGDQSGYELSRELTFQGLVVSTPQATDLGNRVCNDLARGYAENQMGMYLMSQGYSSRQAVAIVGGGRWHFCPWYAPNDVPVNAPQPEPPCVHGDTKYSPPPVDLGYTCENGKWHEGPLGYGQPPTLIYAR